VTLDKYNAHGQKLRSPVSEKAQFVTALGMELPGKEETWKIRKPNAQP
jgi:hypothetical protein